MNNQNNEDSDSNIENILFDERLNQDPIFEEPDEFEAAHVQSLKEKLLHFSRFGNLLTLVLGEAGTGKTYLLEQFMDTLDENLFVCHIEAQPLYTVEQLYQQICTSIATEELIEYPYDNDTFREWLDEIALMSECHVVAIDDAETLSQEVLLEICRLSAYQQTLDVPKVQFMLFASHDLDVSMDNVGRDILDESGIYNIEIPLLDDNDAEQWLKYCLHKAGYLATADELEDLLTENDGNLANLAAIAKSYANEQLEEEQVEIIEEPDESVSFVGFWFAGLTVIVISVLALFFYQKEISQWLFPEQEPVKVVTKQPLSVSEPAEEIITEKSQEKTTVDDTTVTVVDKAPNTKAGDADQLKKTDSLSLDKSEKQGPVKDVVVEIQEEKITEPESKVQTKVDSEKIEQKITDVVETTTEESTSSPEYTLEEQGLLDANDGNYVVQIIGLAKSESIEKILKENSNLELVAYRSLLNGKPWQIIVLPGFVTYQEAQQARLDLPQNLAEFKPWIKSQRKVKEEILTAVSNN